MMEVSEFFPVVGGTPPIGSNVAQCKPDQLGGRLSAGSHIDRPQGCRQAPAAFQLA